MSPRYNYEDDHHVRRALDGHSSINDANLHFICTKR